MQGNTEWLNEIEQCPESLVEGLPGQRPHCANGLWTEPAYESTHPNAAFCMRQSKPIGGGSGQQVMFMHNQLAF